MQRKHREFSDVRRRWVQVSEAFLDILFVASDFQEVEGRSLEDFDSCHCCYMI